MNSSWRREILLAMTALAVCPLTATAQQTFPRPIVLYRPGAAAKPARGPATMTATTVASQPANVQRQPTNAGIPNVANPQNATGIAQAPNISMNAWSSADPKAQQVSATQQFGQTAPANGSGQPANATNSDPQQSNSGNGSANQQSLPTLYALQNASGLHNITQTGMTSSQQYAPNLYFGSQFNTWTNQQTMADSPASYNEMSRYQTGQFGGYVAPNTYFGGGFSSWNNLSSGNASPGLNGGWSYSTWP